MTLTPSANAAIAASGQLDDASGHRPGALNAATGPFHHINYLGGVGGALVFRGPLLTAQLDRTIAKLHRRLDAEADRALNRSMHFPVGWDPFFRPSMTLAEVYAYGAQHYDFHRSQLTLGSS